MNEELANFRCTLIFYDWKNQNSQRHSNSVRRGIADQLVHHCQRLSGGGGVRS